MGKQHKFDICHRIWEERAKDAADAVNSPYSHEC